MHAKNGPVKILKLLNSGRLGWDEELGSVIQRSGLGPSAREKLPRTLKFAWSDCSYFK
jgi:hypothetical protein